MVVGRCSSYDYFSYSFAMEYSLPVRSIHVATYAIAASHHARLLQLFAYTSSCGNVSTT